ncbi:hypothetical protein J6Y50_05925 [bacterium]|nr:hypothetical protein [bacterium]
MLFKLIYKKDDWFVILLTTTAVLCTSKTYLSYTTSGLENAQILMLSSFYLTVLFKNEYFSKKELFKIALLEGLIAFTRMDCALIFAFASAYVFLFRYKKDEKDSGKFSLNKLFQVIPIAILGLLPFILWEMFSWFYYGSFVPNTALAKLNTGFPLSDYLIRGVWYAVKSETWDVFILFIPFCFVLYVGKEFLQNFKIEKFFLTASGVLIYFFYIIYIGGDFMRGRHFLSIFWIALFSFVRLEVDLGKFFAKILMSALVMSVVIAVLFIKVETREYFTDLLSSSPCWFADEHAVYYEHTGLINVLHDYLKRGEITIIRRSPNKGIQWFYGNKQYLSYKNTEDSSYEYRLYDPLLSRLPAIHEKNWRVGHMDRKIPAGYQKTLDTGINYIEDKNLAFYYDKLKFILSGDLFELERLKETVKFNAGVYNNYLLQYIKDNK